MSNPSFRWLKQLTYTLKRAYGQSITFCRTKNDQTNFATGVMTGDVDRVVINRAPVLPASELRKAFKPFIPGRHFEYGGLYDGTSRGVIVDASDLGTFQMDMSAFAIFQNKRYEMKEVIKFEEAEAYILVIDALEGQQRLTEIPLSMTDNLGLSDSRIGAL